MVLYKCPRCNFSSEYKTNIITHIDKKKTVCQCTTGVDVSLIEYREYILNCTFDLVYGFSKERKCLLQTIEDLKNSKEDNLLKETLEKLEKKNAALNAENARLRKIVADHESVNFGKLLRETQKLKSDVEIIKKSHVGESGNPRDYSDFIEDPIIRDIPDFDGYFQISENGNIYSKTSGRELVCSRDKSGYMKISLKKKGFCKTLSIHRVLASLFVPNPHNKPIVDHIDHDRCNNSLGNLRWVSCFENAQNICQETCTESGIRGITKNSSNGSKTSYWNASIIANHNYTSKQFPYTDDGLEEAKRWRSQMKANLHISQTSKNSNA